MITVAAIPSGVASGDHVAMDTMDLVENIAILTIVRITHAAALAAAKGCAQTILPSRSLRDALIPVGIVDMAVIPGTRTDGTHR